MTCLYWGDPNTLYSGDDAGNVFLTNLLKPTLFFTADFLFRYARGSPLLVSWMSYCSYSQSFCLVIPCCIA